MSKPSFQHLCERKPVWPLSEVLEYSLHTENNNAKLRTTYPLFWTLSNNRRILWGFIIFTVMFAKQIQLLLISYTVLLNVVEQLDKRLRWPEYTSPEGDRPHLCQREWEWHVSLSVKKRSWATLHCHTPTCLGMSHSSPSRTLNFGVTREKSGKKSSVHEISCGSVQSHGA